FMTIMSFAQSAATTTSEHFLESGGLRRRYLLHEPSGRDPRKPAPLILMLHGGGGTPEHAGDHRIAEAADSEGYLVAYPEGIDRGWNDGRGIHGRTHDDVGFPSALIDELVKAKNVDPKRVYSTGISNGGFMSFTLACRIPEKLAAIAPVAGSM